MTLTRAGLAQLTWFCEVLVVLVTSIYCVAVGCDISSSASGRLSAESWFEKGFCIWENKQQSFPRDSHDLCIIVDSAIGLVLLVTNSLGYAKCASKPQSKQGAWVLAVMTAIFTMMHGIGHFMIGRVVEGGDFMAGVGAGTTN